MRYVTRRFIYDYAPEIAKVYQHQTVLDQEDVHMEIWDTAGQFQVGTQSIALFFGRLILLAAKLPSIGPYFGVMDE